MIPPFDEHGYLPPDVYAATFEEIAERFGRHTPLRRARQKGFSSEWHCRQ